MLVVAEVETGQVLSVRAMAALAAVAAAVCKVEELRVLVAVQQELRVETVYNQTWEQETLRVELVELTLEVEAEVQVKVITVTTLVMVGLVALELLFLAMQLRGLKWHITQKL